MFLFQCVFFESVCFLKLFASDVFVVLSGLNMKLCASCSMGANRRIWQMAFVPGNEEIIKYTLTLSIQIAYFQSYDFWLSEDVPKKQKHVQKGNNLSGIPPVQQFFPETDMKLRYPPESRYKQRGSPATNGNLNKQRAGPPVCPVGQEQGNLENYLGWKMPQAPQNRNLKKTSYHKPGDSSDLWIP